MLKSNAVPGSSITYYSHPSETVSAAAADDDQLNIPRSNQPRKEGSFTDKASLEYQSVTRNIFKKIYQ
ncbi:unnamed protein product [Rotaria socialis]|uniref:Uncharacterized protein n=2 Tax=Rotaria socialis TaxID=392032 RepID=A0A821AIY4_9BILA|nr:unnamed protein product [Rotaria socialis]CAF4577733.1 unnamed protein product [Rotaria socialis]CAF4892105.1 unnamed protein product [Rotaria socialis]